MNEATKQWVGGVCIKDDQVLLIRRINKDRVGVQEYFVFPGREVEGDESIEGALIEEFEGLSIKVTLSDLIYSKGDEGDDEQEFYYLSTYLLGEPALHQDCEEVKIMEDNHNQLYLPMWVSINELEDLIIYPESVKAILLEKLEEGK
jgi:ADP-ribose pyrophosphatase YjhB (NUDIX family)